MTPHRCCVHARQYAAVAREHTAVLDRLCRLTGADSYQTLIEHVAVLVRLSHPDRTSTPPAANDYVDQFILDLAWNLAGRPRAAQGPQQPRADLSTRPAMRRQAGRGRRQPGKD